MPEKLPIILFAGPSLSIKAKKLILQSRIQLKQPIQRGDLEKLTNEYNSCIIAIVDGVFKQVMAVGHKEILHTLRKGYPIYGLSSMGAIRAKEMHPYGMIGFGQVFERFMSEEDFQDDEVALLHAPAPYYFMASEPLIHFRACVDYLVRNNELTEKTGTCIIRELKQLYFGERTVDRFKSLLLKYGLGDLHLLNDFDQFRLKMRDVELFLEQRPWQERTG